MRNELPFSHFMETAPKELGSSFIHFFFLFPTKACMIRLVTQFIWRKEIYRGLVIFLARFLS